MGICGTKPDPKNNMIDKQIRDDRKIINKTTKILLLGIGESGKSTIIKQFINISTNDQINPNELLANRPFVYRTIFEELYKIITIYMDEGQEMKKTRPETILKIVEQILIICTKNLFYNEEDLNKIVGMKEDILELLTEQDFIDIYKNIDEYKISSNLRYFLIEENFSRIFQQDYIPNLQDILYVRNKTTGVNENPFKYTDNNQNIHDGILIDVGGQRGERRKWIHCFENVGVMIYCASLIDYDLQVPETENSNRLEESLTVFEGLINSPWLEGINVKILFLNKIDLFKEKILKYPLDKHLPDSLRKRPDVPKFKSGSNMYEDSCQYIKKLYLEKVSEPLCGKSKIEVYCHFTCAVSRDNIELVFNQISDKIFSENLDKMGI